MKFTFQHSELELNCVHPKQLNYENAYTIILKEQDDGEDDKSCKQNDKASETSPCKSQSIKYDKNSVYAQYKFGQSNKLDFLNAFFATIRKLKSDVDKLRVNQAGISRINCILSSSYVKRIYAASNNLDTNAEIDQLIKGGCDSYDFKEFAKFANHLIKQVVIKILDGLYYFDQHMSDKIKMKIMQINFCFSSQYNDCCSDDYSCMENGNECLNNQNECNAMPSGSSCHSNSNQNSSDCHTASHDQDNNSYDLNCCICHKSIEQEIINIIESINLVKNLANNPANVATPSYLAKNMVDFVASLDADFVKSCSIRANIYNKREIEEMKMGAFLAVAQGAVEEPKFIVMEYFGNSSGDPINDMNRPIVLVGKGITFDTGGISLKPSSNMDDMKYDMCGAASVLGVFQATVRLKLKVNLVVLVPTCENMPSGCATRPGDIVTSMSRKTIEILNTDAEGRLILCDALEYAKRYNPSVVVDVATLTGACVVALGSVLTGAYSNDEMVYAKMLESSMRTGDKIWRMPLGDEYHELLKSKSADIANLGGWSGKAGSVTAACFLEKFVDYKWMHLDIAGVAYNTAEVTTGGATARPFMLLLDFIQQYQ